MQEPKQSVDPYIERLENEKRALEKKIEDLRSEIRSINNLIIRHRSKLLSEDRGENVNLKNADRIFFENLIEKTLEESRHGLRTSEIYDKLIYDGYKVNYNTVRSYIARMRNKKSIKKNPKSPYRWIPG